MPLIRALEKRKFLDGGPVPQVLNMGTNLASMLLCLQDGQELAAPPSDTSETLFCVLSGAGFVREGSEVHAVETGDVVHVPAGETKALVAGDGQLSVLGVRSMGGHIQAQKSAEGQKGRKEVQKFDVREIKPRERHAQIFSMFDGLESGQAFELVNDHDPKPLYYQFQAERPGQVTWEYLEEGPNTWRVKVGRV